MNRNIEVQRYKLKEEKILKTTLENCIITFELNGGCNSVHLKDIIRLTGTVINEKKEAFSIFVNIRDGHFFQADGMFCFIDENEYIKCYTSLLSYLNFYNNNIIKG